MLSILQIMKKYNIFTLHVPIRFRIRHNTIDFVLDIFSNLGLLYLVYNK